MNRCGFIVYSDCLYADVFIRTETYIYDIVTYTRLCKLVVYLRKYKPNTHSDPYNGNPHVNAEAHELVCSWTLGK